MSLADGYNIFMRSRIQIPLIAILIVGFVGPDPLASLPGPFDQDCQELAQADTVCEGTVVTTESLWRQDEQGRHIYTRVRLNVVRRLRGRLAGPGIELEVQGGTVGQITERVSHMPIFRRGEQVVVFLRGGRLVGGVEGKLPVRDGHVIWRGRRIRLDQLVSILGQDRQDDQQPTDNQRLATSPGPAIISIDPCVAAAGIGQEVNIVGVGLGQRKRESFVDFFYRSGKPRLIADVVWWDETTIRCLVPVDVVEGYSASASSGPVSAVINGSRTNELILRVTYGYDGSRWAEPVVRYLINENFPDCQDEAAAIRRAAQTWNQTGAGFRFEYAGIHSGLSSSYNGKNQILYGNTSKGIAVTWTWEVSGTVLECDTVFSNRYRWSTADQPAENQMDLQTVALHEFGHWVGLRDLYGDIGDGEYDTGKVMYGFGRYGAVKRTLHPDDVAGIHFVYPPSVPQDIPATIEYPDLDEDGRFTVIWSSCPQASGYQLQRSEDGGLTWEELYIGPHTYHRQITDPGLYLFRVRALNTAGPSDWRQGDKACLVLAAE